MLREESFYPLMLCTLLCFALLMVRGYILHRLEYLFLVKNLFLAWVPCFFSLAVVWLGRARPRARVRIAMLFCGWLVMFPNAPYVFTDLIHWRNRVGEMPWWFDLGLVLMFALAGCFAGIVSLRIMHDLVRRRFGEIIGWSFVATAALLSGFGVYLGRFQRWNSWDLLTCPHRIASGTLRGLTSPGAQGRSIGVTLMFGAMVLVTYLMFVTTSAARAPQRAIQRSI
jgi:uncharacterized membrane protein